MFPTGGIVWRYRYRLNGKYEKLTLKNTRLTRDEAAQQMAMGESPAKKKQQAKAADHEDATVAEFSERFFKDIQARDRALTPDEIRQFLRAMQTSNIRRQFKIAFQLILMILVRKSELMLAQWKDVHVDEGEWHIPVENSETGKPHIVYLSTQAQTLFKELKPLASSSDWVLPGRGTLAKPFASNALNQALKASLQRQETLSSPISDSRR